MAELALTPRENDLIALIDDLNLHMQNQIDPSNVNSDFFVLESIQNLIGEIQIIKQKKLKQNQLFIKQLTGEVSFLNANAEGRPSLDQVENEVALNLSKKANLINLLNEANVKQEALKNDLSKCKIHQNKLNQIQIKAKDNDNNDKIKPSDNSFNSQSEDKENSENDLEALEEEIQLLNEQCIVNGSILALYRKCCGISFLNNNESDDNENVPLKGLVNEAGSLCGDVYGENGQVFPLEIKNFNELTDYQISSFIWDQIDRAHQTETLEI